jgi:hypothetical protein
MTRRPSEGPLTGYVGEIARLRFTFPHAVDSTFFHGLADPANEEGNDPTETTVACSLDKPRGETTAAIAWELENSGEYYLTWVDRKGRYWESRRRFPIRVLPEPSPKLDWKSPPKRMAVQPDARVPLRFSLSQDRGIKKVELAAEVEFPASDETRHLRKTLFSAPDSPRRELEISRLWEIGPLELPVGTEIRYRLDVEMLPDREVSLPLKEAREPPAFLLEIVSRQEWHQRQSQRRSRLLEALRRLIHMLEEGNRQVEALHSSVASGKATSASLRSNLRAVGGRQEEVTARLTSSSGNGVEAMLESFREARSLEALTTGSRFDAAALGELLRQIRRGPLPAVRLGLERCRQTVSSMQEEDDPFQSVDRESLSDSLREVASSQIEIIELLRQMESLLEEYSEKRRRIESRRSLLEEQRNLREAFSTFPARSIGLPWEMLAPQEQATLEGWAERQRGMARKLSVFRQSRTPGLPSTEQQDSFHARVHSQMMQAAAAIESNRLGEARRWIDSIVRALVSLLEHQEREDSASSTERGDGKSILAAKPFDEQVAQWVEQQETLLEATIQLDQQLGASGGSISRTDAFALTELAAEQQALAETTRRAVEMGIGEPVFRLLLSDVVDQMGQAAAFLESQQTGKECRRLQRSVIDLLRWMETAQRSIASLDQTPPAETAGGEEGGEDRSSEMGRGGRQVRLLRELQKVILIDTGRLASERFPPRSEKFETRVRRLADRQSLLAERTRTLASGERKEGEASPPKGDSENTLLVAVAGMMGNAASRLARGEVGEAVRGQQAEILRVLEKMLPNEGGLRRQGGSTSEAIAGAENNRSGENNAGIPGEGASSGGDPTSGTAAGREGERETSGEGGEGVASSEADSRLGRIWGELPERTRRELEQFTGEHFLPAYREMIESYYRRLSELEPARERDQ